MQQRMVLIHIRTKNPTVGSAFFELHCRQRLPAGHRTSRSSLGALLQAVCVTLLSHSGPHSNTHQRTARTAIRTLLAPQPQTHAEQRAEPRPAPPAIRTAAGIRPALARGPTAAPPGPPRPAGRTRSRPALSADPHGPAPRPQRLRVSRPALRVPAPPPRAALPARPQRLPGATRRSSLRRSPAHPTRVRPSAPSSAPPSLSSPPVSSHPPPRPEVTPRKRADPRLLPSLAFFLLASVPPSLPRKESSFFLDGGDFGVGDLGEEGDFWGDDAMAAGPALGDGGGGCEAPEPWEAAPGSERKRNYSRHLRQLRSALPLLPCLPPALRHAPPPAAAPLRPHLSRRGTAFPPRHLAPSCGSAHLGLRRGPTRSAKSLAAPQLGCGRRRSFGTGRAQPGSPSGAGPRGGAAGRRPPELRAARSESWELVGSCSHVAALEGWALQAGVSAL